MSPSTCLVSTSVNPAAASIRRAVCSPHMVPRPMPPAARVSHAACAGGSVQVIAAGSWSTMRPAGHRRQPFPHVAFVQPGNLGDPSAGGRRQRGHRVEQAATVTDADHQRQHARVQHVQHPLGELRRSGQARLLGHGHPPSTPATRRPPRRPENGSRLPKNLKVDRPMSGSPCGKSEPDAHHRGGPCRCAWAGRHPGLAPQPRRQSSAAPRAIPCWRWIAGLNEIPNLERRE